MRPVFESVCALVGIWETKCVKKVLVEQAAKLLSNDMLCVLKFGSQLIINFNKN